MTLKHVQALFVFLILGIKVTAQETEYEPPAYVRYVHEIMDSFVDDMKEEFGLTCIGTGGGMPHDVEEISLEFEAEQRATIKEARRLEVLATEKLLQKINAHEKIRPYLREYPFLPNRVMIGISFHPNKKRAPYLNANVSRVSQGKNNIRYYTENALLEKNENLFEESYSDAVKALGNKKPPLSDKASSKS